MSLPAIPDPADIDVAADPAAALVALVEPATQWLAQASDVAQVHDTKAKAAALARYSRARGLADEAIRSAVTIELRAGAALGRLMPEQTELGRGKKVSSDEDTFSRDQRHRFRLLDTHEAVMEDAIANMPTSRLSVHGVLYRIRQERKQEENAELISQPMPTGEYRTIVADPPWRYDNAGTRGAAEDHYPTMTITDICAMEVPAADDAHCYLWVTNNFIGEGLDVLKAWGFEYKTMLTWCKPQIGLGNYFRNSTEHVMFGVRGRLALMRSDVGTWFGASRAKHSAKPDAFYDIVETCSPGPWLELFSRSPREGWNAWGNQA